MRGCEGTRGDVRGCEGPGGSDRDLRDCEGLKGTIRDARGRGRPSGTWGTERSHEDTRRDVRDQEGS